jgi:polar amino acid transport system substrate-binding protein/glutamate/aspartate transport system substrate-binding protein
MPRYLRLALAGLVGATLAGPALAQGVLDRLKETGEIRLGVRADAAPLSFLLGEEPAGYSVLVCNGVVEELGEALGRTLTATWVTVDADTRFDAVANGEIDLLCGAATITLERRATVNFSLPTFVDGAAVLLPRDADPEFDALAGKRIGVRAGTTTEESLRASLEAKGMQAEVVTFDDHPAALSALEAGEIEAYFGDQSILFGLFFASDMGDTLTVSENTMTVEKQGLAMPRGDDDFRLAVDTAISTLFRDGRMERFFVEAFPGATPGLALRALFLLGPEMP